MSGLNADMPVAGRWPDFIIVGAMKSATTSLHQMLAEHPRIFMPVGEVGFFDHDDYVEHLSDFIGPDNHWVDLDFEEDLARKLDAYCALFARAGRHRLAGEDSTTYLSSRKAPARIARHVPEARIIIMLREPAARAYSQYWHMVRDGGIFHSFEDTLRLMPERILSRSCYVEPVRRYLGLFPRERVHFLAFENFQADPAREAARVLEFLGIDSNGFQPSTRAQHSNPARIPRSLTWQLLRNRLRWRADLKRQAREASGQPRHRQAAAERSSLQRRVHYAIRRLNPVTVERPPPMQPQTKRFLTALLRRENAGLSDLVGIDLEALWYKSKSPP